MFNSGKLKRSWQLFGNSLQVMKQNKKLLLFPIVALFFTLIVVAFFFAPVLWQWSSIGQSLVALDGPTTHHKGHIKAAGYVLLAGIYLVSMFMATLFNVAFYSEIMKALAGETVSIRAGLAFAMSRIKSIFIWSLFAGVIGLIIESLEERFGWIGRLVLGAVGMLWSVASIFVIPVMIRDESTNPVQLLRHSANTLKKTWGESLIGYIGIELGSGLFLLGSLILLGAVTAISIMQEQYIYIILVGSVWLLATIALGYLVHIAGTIYRCALYIYASEGVVPGPYTVELMDTAWKVKKIS